ncbi:MAG TPA: hypothetical protein VM935_15835, partial [Chitinophagaceae bacterium]|nr:hypothetical protein [Chitinophagaceae bacterium]
MKSWIICGVLGIPIMWVLQRAQSSPQQVRTVSCGVMGHINAASGHYTNGLGNLLIDSSSKGMI